MSNIDDWMDWYVMQPGAAEILQRTRFVQRAADDPAGSCSECGGMAAMGWMGVYYCVEHVPPLPDELRSDTSGAERAKTVEELLAAAAGK